MRMAYLASCRGKTVRGVAVAAIRLASLAIIRPLLDESVRTAQASLDHLKKQHEALILDHVAFARRLAVLEDNVALVRTAQGMTKEGSK